MISKVFIVFMDVRDGTESKYPSNFFLSIFTNYFKTSPKMFLLRTQNICLIGKNDNNYFWGFIYLYFYLSIIRTTDNSKKPF